MTRGDRAPWGRLDAADSAAALARLLGAPQFPLLGLLAVAGVRHGIEGVLAGTELEAHRRAADLEHLAEGVGQVAAVGLGQRLGRSEEHTSELQSRPHLVCRLLLEKKKKK